MGTDSKLLTVPAVARLDGSSEDPADNVNEGVSAGGSAQPREPRICWNEGLLAGPWRREATTVCRWQETHYRSQWSSSGLEEWRPERGNLQLPQPLGPRGLGTWSVSCESGVLLLLPLQCEGSEGMGCAVSLVRPTLQVVHEAGQPACGLTYFKNVLISCQHLKIKNLEI